MAPRITPELDALFDALLGSEKQRIFDHIGEKLPHTFRFNPLKGDVAVQRDFFLEQGFRFHPMDGRDDIFIIDEQPYPIGKSLSHFMGHIYVQDIASMIPPLVLDPQPGDWVLDMSAAPGSKTTQMGAMMANRGVILANDVVLKRLKALSKNVERMSMCNTLINRWFGEQYGNVYFEQFDRVLLDPACSGLGTLHKNPEILDWWTPKHCERLAGSQKNQLISAVKALRPGGVLVYSTCTLTPEENEANVQFVLDEFPMEIEPIAVAGLTSWPGLTEFGGRRFHPDMDRTIRLYPMDRVTEGFFVARLRKTASSGAPHPGKRKEPRQTSYLTHKTSPVKKYVDNLVEQFDIKEKVFKPFLFTMNGERIAFLSREFDEFPIFGKPLQLGTVMARALDRSTRLNSGGTHLLGPHARRNVIDLPDLATLETFANREPLSIEVEKPGQHIVRYRGMTIGYGIVEKGVFKSQFPKGEWPFQLTGGWESPASPSDVSD